MSIENTVGEIEKILEIVESNRGTIQEVEREKLYLEATRKQNELLDLEIEMKKVQIEIQKIDLKQRGG